MTRLAKITAVVVTALLLLVTTAVGASARVATLGASGFSSTGDEISGWYWVRSSGQTATWTFDRAALGTARPRSVHLNVTALVTNGANGGSGYSAPAVTFRVACGARVQRIVVSLDNPFLPVDPEDSGGVGYQAYGAGSTPVNLGKLGGCDALVVSTGFPFPSGRHIAFGQDSLVLGFRR